MPLIQLKASVQWRQRAWSACMRLHTPLALMKSHPSVQRQPAASVMDRRWYENGVSRPVSNKSLVTACSSNWTCWSDERCAIDTAWECLGSVAQWTTSLWSMTVSWSRTAGTRWRSDVDSGGQTCRETLNTCRRGFSCQLQFYVAFVALLSWTLRSSLGSVSR